VSLVADDAGHRHERFGIIVRKLFGCVALNVITCGRAAVEKWRHGALPAKQAGAQQRLSVTDAWMSAVSMMKIAYTDYRKAPIDLNQRGHPQTQKGPGDIERAGNSPG
jgi:hypothetical protein